MRPELKKKKKMPGMFGSSDANTEGRKGKQRWRRRDAQRHADVERQKMRLLMAGRKVAVVVVGGGKGTMMMIMMTIMIMVLVVVKRARRQAEYRRTEKGGKEEQIKRMQKNAKTGCRTEKMLGRKVM